jgi:hypothetical protein
MTVCYDVLVVDDDRLVIWILEECVREAGCSAHLATSAVEALEILKANAAIRLLVTDIRMPRMDGNQLIRQARQLRPDLEIVIVTGNVDEAEFRDEYPLIAKPFFPQQLTGVISEVVKHRLDPATPSATGRT